MQEHPQGMRTSLARHHDILRLSISAHNGHIFQIIGDAFCTAFEHAPDALAASLEAQRALHSEGWEETGPLRVRMGLHTGVAEVRGGEYLSSLTLVRVQRVMSAGHGGQILLSPTTAELIRHQLPSGAILRDLGKQYLRGLIQLERIFQIITPDLPAQFPPLRIDESKEMASESTSILERLVQGRLVARKNELQKLQERWRLAQQGHGHIVMLSGEPGIGKTRLADELISQAHKDGAAILRGGCYEYEATTSYLPFVEALRDWVNRQTADALRAQVSDTAIELAKLAPELEIKLGPFRANPPLGPKEERLRLFDNIARFLQSLAASRGVLLFIDDLHWADRGSLSLLHYVMRHLRYDRAMVLSAYRDMELNRSHPLAGVLVDWNREHLITRLFLSRFNREDTTSMLTTLLREDTISPEFANLVFRETEGNPFFVEEVVKALIEQGEIYRSGDHWDRREIHELTVPQSVKEAVGRRLSRLSEPCAELLTMAAGLGKQFLFSELVAIATSDEDETLDALDEAVAAQLIESTGAEGFSFTHDKIREVMIEELNPIRRRRLHRLIGEGLERFYTDSLDGCAEDLAYHFTLSGNLEKSIGYSLRAAKSAASMFGHDEALAYFEQAREAAEEIGLLDQVVSIDESIGEVHSQRGETVLAVEALKQALAGITATDRQASIKSRIGCVYGVVGDPRGLPYLHEAVNELDSQSQTDDLAIATAFLGRYHHYDAQHTKAIEYLEQARKLAEPSGNPQTLQTIYGYLAGAYQHLAQFDKSDEWAWASITLGEQKKHLLARATGNEFLAENQLCRGDWDEALNLTSKNRELADKIGALHRRAWSEYPRLSALWGQGRLTEAYRIAQAALELCEQIGEKRLATWIEPSLALIATDLKEDEKAEGFARRGLHRGESLGQVALHCFSLHAMGYWHMRCLRWKEAVQYYDQVLAKLRPTENRVILMYSQAYTAEAFLGIGRVEESMELIDEVFANTDFAQAAHLMAVSRRIQAQAFVKLGYPEKAGNAFEEAISELDRLGSRLELGRTHYHRAELLLEIGEPEQARTDTERAISILASCDARRDTERIQTLLARLK